MLNIDGLDLYEIPGAGISINKSIKHFTLANIKDQRASYIWGILKEVMYNLIRANTHISNLTNKDVEAIKDLMLENIRLNTMSKYNYVGVSFIHNFNRLIIVINKIYDGFAAMCKLLGHNCYE